MTAYRKILLFLAVSFITGLQFQLSAQVTGEYRSFATGNWNVPGSWETFNGTIWVGAGTAPTGNEPTITILNTHDVTIPTGLQVTVTTQLDVNSGGTLTLRTNVPPFSAGTRLTMSVGSTLNNLGTITVTSPGGPVIGAIINGTLFNQGTINNTNASKFQFGAGSLYDHAFTAAAGTIPTATWNLTSTCRITSSGDLVPAGLSQSFGNFEWNYPTQTAFLIDLGGQLTTVNGNLSLISSGFSGMTLNGAGGTYTVNIGGNLICNEYFEFNNLSGTTTVNVAGNLSLDDPNTTFASYLVLNSGSGQTNLNIDGDLLIDNTASGASTIDMSFGGSGSSQINLKGNYTTQNGGNLFSGFGSGTYNLVFNGTTAQIITESNVLNGIDIAISSSAIVSIPDGGGSNFLGTDQSFTVGSNAILRVGSSHANGAIQTGSSNGNIRVGGTRSYALGSTIEYNGANQFLGNGHPSTAGVNTTINNTSGNTTLTSDATIGGNLALTMGNLVVPAGNTLTMNGTFSAGANSLNVTSTSNLVIGNAASPFGTLITSGSTTINNLTVTRPGQLFSIGNNLRIDGTFTHDASSVNFDNSILTIGNNYVPTSGSLIGNTSSTLIITGLGTVGIIPLAGTLGTLTIDQPSGVVNTTSVTINTALNILTGTYSGAGSVTMGVGATLTRRDGVVTKAMTATDYNLVYTNTAAITTGNELITSPSTALTNLTINGSNTVMLDAGLTNVTVNGNLNLTTGIFNSNSKGLEFKGNISSNATGTFTGSVATFSGSTTLSGVTPLVLDDVVITSTGTLNLGAGTVDFTGNIDHDNGGAIIAGTGTARFNGTSTITCDINNVPRFNNVQILSGGSMGINCVSASCGTAPNQFGVEVSGNWNSNTSGAAFTPSSGRVILNGTTQSIETLASHSFFGLQLLGTGTITLNNSLRVTSNFIVGQNATLNSGSSQPISVGGDFLLNGNFVPNQGTVTFNGTGNQKIDRTVGSGAATKGFYNITVNKSGGTFNVTSTIASTTFTVSNEFRVSQNGASAIDVDFDGPSNTGTLVLLSTATATARIPAVASAASVGIQGNLTVQRYIQNDDGSRAYRYFASPVVNNTTPSSNGTISDWQQEIQITGLFSNPSTGAGIPNPNSPSLYRWTETNGGLASNRYEPWPNNISLAANTFALTNGVGYAVFVRNQGNPVLNTRGTLRYGNVGITLTRTGSEADAAGFNLIGNPYPAPIDWDLVTVPGNVSSTISMLDNVSNANLGPGQYVYYVQGGPDIGNFNGIIASGQAFWAELTSGTSATLTFTESNKTSDLNPVVVRERSLANLLRVKVNGVDSKDELVIYLIEDATDGIDLKFDAAKKINSSINLYSFFESSPMTRYAINGVNGIECSRTFKLGINEWDASMTSVIPVGDYTFEFSELESFTTDYQITLVDNFEGITTNLKESSNYSFSVSEALGSFGDQRFEIVISQAPIETDKFIEVADVCSGTNAQITISNSQSGVEYYASLNGNTISSFYTGNGNGIELIIDGGNLSLNENNIVVYGVTPGCSPIPMNQEVVIRKDEVYAISSVEGGAGCNNAAITLSATGAPTSSEYAWYESETASSPIVNENKSEFTTPVLLKSKTYYVAAVNSLGCEGPRVPVLAEVTTYDDVDIEIEDGVLVSTHDVGNQWYKDDVLLAGATGQRFTPESTGVYKVQVKIGGCTTSAQRVFTITGVEDLDIDALINVYPNPVGDYLNVEVLNRDVISISVIDMMGKNIGELAMKSVDNKLFGTLDFKNQPGGLYILKVSDSNGKIYNKRIIKK